MTGFAGVVSALVGFIVFFSDWHHWQRQPEWLTVAGGLAALVFWVVGVVLIGWQCRQDIDDCARRDLHWREQRFARARYWETWKDSEPPRRRRPREEREAMAASGMVVNHTEPPIVPADKAPTEIPQPPASGLDTGGPGKRGGSTT